MWTLKATMVGSKGLHAGTNPFRPALVNPTLAVWWPIPPLPDAFVSYPTHHHEYEDAGLLIQILQDI